MEAQYFQEEELQDRQETFAERELQEQSAVSDEIENEQETTKIEQQEVRKEPAPAKRRRKPEMFVPQEEVAAGKEMAYAKKPEKGRTGEELLERSMEEVEKEKIIEDILKEYLV